MAAALERAQDLSRGDRPEAAQILCARHVPLPLGRGPARGPSARLHSLGHLFALQASVRIQRAASYGLRRVRSARRAVCHPDGPAPRRHHRAQHSALPRAVGQDRILFRLGSRGAHLRPRLLQMDPVGVPEDVRQLLLQRLAKGASDIGAHGGVRRARNRGSERRLHSRDAFHGRGVARVGRGEARAGVAELPLGLSR